MVQSATLFTHRAGFETETRPVFNTRRKVFVLDPYGVFKRRVIWVTREGIEVVFLNRIAYRYVAGALIDSWEQWF